MHVDLQPDMLTKRLNGLTIAADTFADQKFLAAMASMVFRGKGRITLEGEGGKTVIDIGKTDIG